MADVGGVRLNLKLHAAAGLQQNVRLTGGGGFLGRRESL